MPDMAAGFSVEAQIASLADRIAYDCHDLEDAVGAGFIGLEDLARVALWESAYQEASSRDGPGHIHAVRRGVLDAMLDTLIRDAVETSRRRLAPAGPIDEVQKTADASVTVSEAAAGQLSELEAFLVEHVYERPEVSEMDARGRRMVLALFEAYRAHPHRLPDRFAARIAEQGPSRVICDYIAGMTDRFCEAEHDRLVRG
jgi:dGTPase